MPASSTLSYLFVLICHQAM